MLCPFYIACACVMSSFNPSLANTSFEGRSLNFLKSFAVGRPQKGDSPKFQSIPYAEERSIGTAGKNIMCLHELTTAQKVSALYFQCHPIAQLSFLER